MEHSKITDSVVATVNRRAGCENSLKAEGRYVVQCHGPDGTLKWGDVIDNLVTTQGRNDQLDKHLGGVAYTAAWYLGLVSSTGYSALAVGDTAAAHAGWQEAGTAIDPDYDDATRPVAAFSAAAAGVKATSALVTFVFATAGIVKGAFLSSSSVKDGAGGVLYSVGLFALGDKTVGIDDTLSIGYEASLT